MGYQQYYDAPADVQYTDSNLPELNDVPLETSDEDDTL